MTSLSIGHKGLTKEIIVDGQLAVPGSPTPTDVANQNYQEHTIVVYVGGGTTTLPDYVWFVDEDLSVTQTSSPGGGGGGSETVDNLQWSVVGSTGTINLSQTPLSNPETKFLMASGLTYLGDDQVSIVGQVATIDADEYGILDGEDVKATYAS